MPELLELNRLKEIAGIPLSDASQDSYLESLAAAASEIVEGYLRRQLESKERTETLHQQGECLILRAFPVKTVTYIKAAGVEITGYQISPDSGMIRREGGWPRESLGYEIKYTGGMEIPYPKTLQQAALLVALQLRTAAGQGGQGAASERLGDYSITYLAPSGPAGAAGLEALNPAAAALLRPWMGGCV